MELPRLATSRPWGREGAGEGARDNPRDPSDEVHRYREARHRRAWKGLWSLESLARSCRPTVVFFRKKYDTNPALFSVYFVDRGSFKYCIFSLPLRQSYCQGKYVFIFNFNSI
jgi:hypothetical protein